MRDAVVDRELEHLRVDHDEAALLGLQPVEERQDHGVDGDRLARAGGAGDEEMRHAGEIGDHRLAADGLAEAERELVLRRFEVLARQELAQIDRLALEVRQLDADGVAALHHGDAGRHRAHRAGDVVGERDDARGFRARRRLELVEGDDRAGADVDDLAADAEILERRIRAASRSARARPRTRSRPATSSARPAAAAAAAGSVRRRGARAGRRATGACRASARPAAAPLGATAPARRAPRPALVVRRRPPRAARRCRVENRLAPERCAAGRGEGRLAAGVRGLDPSPQRRLQAHEAVRERAERDDAPAGLLLARRVVVVDAAAGRLVALGRHLRALVGDAEAAGGREGEDGDAREGEADQRRAGAARDAEHGLRRAEKRVADDPAEPGRQGPAAGRRQRARDRRRGAASRRSRARAAGAGGGPCASAASCQPQTAIGVRSSTDASPKSCIARSATIAPGRPRRLRTAASVALLRLGSSTDQVASAVVTTPAKPIRPSPRSSAARRSRKARNASEKFS